jgi:hypothetical protein
MDAHTKLAPSSEPSARENPILAEHVNAIRALGKQAVEDVVEIGCRLTACKKLVGHGNWLPWLKHEFGWSDQTARNFMRIADLSKSKTVLNLDLPLKALYLLAAPSTPTEARDEIIERAATGAPIAVAEVKRVVDTAKGRKPSHRPRKAGRAKATEPPPQGGRPEPTPRDDIGADSPGEAERLRVVVEELQADKRRLEIKVRGLESEVEDLKAAAKSPPERKPGFWCSICHEKKHALLRPVFICDGCVDIYEVREAAPPPDDGLDIPGFMDRRTQGAVS